MMLPFLSQPQVEVLLIGILVVMACSLPGVFLVLRGMSMMSDAITHSVLLGIVVAFFFVGTLNSPLLIVGAAIAGLVTVSLTEGLIATRKVKEDASIGLVFPFLFAIGVLLISRYAGDVHLDTDAVLLGEIAFAPFDRFVAWGIDLGPQSLWIMGSIFLVNLLVILALYKEFKLSTFDRGLATSLGFRPGWMHYLLMGLVSVTAVGAFDVVGSILVVAFIVVPPATAYLLTRRLWQMIPLSMLLGVIAVVSGFLLATWWDVSIAGMMAAMTGMLFLLVFLFAPGRGFLAKMLRHRRQRWQFAVHMLLVHLLDHEGTPREKEESRIKTIDDHMRWEDRFAARVIYRASDQKLVDASGEYLRLTEKGRETAKSVMVSS